MSGHHHDHGHRHRDRQRPGPPRLEEVADGVFAYIQPDGTWWINNAGFVTGADGVLAVDTCSTERRTRDFLETLRGVTPAPLRTLVNTHHHGDHTHGNYLTHPATIVAHEQCREAMLLTGILQYEGVFEMPDWGNLELAPPTLTFTDEVTVWVGDTKVELHYIGSPAHTTGDVVAWLPERRVLYSGDLVFNGGTPFVLMGSVEGSLKAIEQLRRFDADVVVPGHGDVCDLSALERIADYLRFVQSVAADMVSSGVTPLEAARSTDLGEFAELTDSERLVGNLHRAKSEVEGAELGAPIDIITAIADMVTFNDGRPLRCVA